LRYYTQIDARNRHGTQRGGKKVRLLRATAS
jgi:hypothetical protein